MFVAMNNFAVNPERADDFERTWRERETHLEDVPGFMHFVLLRSDDAGHYVSHSTWRSRAHFEAWTQSEAFTAGHRGGGSMAGILVDHPRVELFESVTESSPRATT
jgi:heme-degrading monooxygenase HmoA